jgi:hypothetical protein
MNYNLRLGVISILACGSLLPCHADELSSKGRDILEKNQDSVVTVQVVLKTTYSGSNSRETTQDISGTVVDPAGLTVVALSACDPNEMLQRIMPEEFSRRNVQSEVTDVRLLLENGTDIPSEIVLRDKDFDLAFIRPKTKPATPMAAIDLNQSSQAQVLDQVLALSRLNSAAGRTCAASAERISAVIKRPRRFYIPETSPTATTPGAPAFALDGNIIGIFVTRAISVQGGARNVRNSVTGIILPAEDILKASKQAPTTPKPESEKKPVTDEKSPAK